MYVCLCVSVCVCVCVCIGQGDRCAHVDYARGDPRGACVSFIIVIMFIIIGNNIKTYFTLVNFRYFARTSALSIGHTYFVLVALLSELTLLPWFADWTCELIGG